MPWRRKSGDHRVAFANTLRGIAAVCVVIAHFGPGFLVYDRTGAANFLHLPAVDIEPVPAAAYLDYFSPYFVFAFFGVALFFLISGFVLPFSLERSNATQFAINRALRIYPLYAVGLTASLLALAIGARYSGVDWYYPASEVVTSYIPGFRDMFMWAVRIDGISWTLEIEVKFYLICLAAILLFRKRSLALFLIPLFLAAATILLQHVLADILPISHFWWLRAQVLMASAPYLVYMFIGTAFYQYWVGRLSLPATAIIVAILGAAFVISMHYGLPSLFVMVWSYGVAAVVFALLIFYPRLLPTNRVTDFLADISYPLYVVHCVVGYVLIRLLVLGGLAPLPAVGLATLFVVGLAWAMHAGVEVPVGTLSRKLQKKAGQRHPLAGPAPAPSPATDELAVPAALPGATLFRTGD